MTQVRNERKPHCRVCAGMGNVVVDERYKPMRYEPCVRCAGTGRES